MDQVQRQGRLHDGQKADCRGGTSSGWQRRWKLLRCPSGGQRAEGRPKLRGDRAGQHPEPSDQVRIGQLDGGSQFQGLRQCPKSQMVEPTNQRPEPTPSGGRHG
uniref:(northern house mosquito) hypothetical protein n=1 Tax=Culex pipiens TaxID=7175 RepID=A0A8D8EYB6_CULPI